MHKEQWKILPKSGKKNKNIKIKSKNIHITPSVEKYQTTIKYIPIKK